MIKNKYLDLIGQKARFLVEQVYRNINLRGFGKERYIKSIEDHEVRNGTRAAISKLIKDIEIFYKEFKELNDINTGNLYDLINRLVVKNNKVDMEIHYFRNKLNKVPLSLDELIKYNNENKDKRWCLMSPLKSAFHMKGKNGVYNLKFLSYNGHFEAVYNKEGILLDEKNDPSNMGTYNFFSPDDEKNHAKYDVKPYLKWGNTKEVGSDGEFEELAKAAANIAEFKINLKAKEKYEEMKKLLKDAENK